MTRRPRNACHPLGDKRARTAAPTSDAWLRMDDKRRVGVVDADGGEEGADVGFRAVGGEGAGELVGGGGFGQRGDHVSEATLAGDCRLDRVRGAVRGWRRGERRPHLLDQRRARFGGPVLVAVAVGEEEAAARQRQADGEEVALLGFGVAARVEAEPFALGLGEERVAAAVAAGELAVLEGADEDVVEAGGAQAVGAGDPHPAFDRAAPDAEVERADGLGETLRGGGERPERGEVGERRGDLTGGA